MKAYQIRIFLFIILQAMLWQKTNSMFMDFHCKGMDEQETEKMETKFNGLREIGKGSYAQVRGNKEYVIKRISALNYILDEFNSEVRTMLVFKDQLEIVKFYEDEEGRYYKDFQCFYPKNQGKYVGYLIIPKYFTTLHSYITVKSTSLIHRPSWKFDMMIKLTIGLKKLHENGFIHCDLKPENIFLVDQFYPLIGDLGETITMYETKDHKSGTNEYLAPEIQNAQNKFTYTNKVDIFALGILFVDIIAASMSVEDFVPQQEKFKLQNIENYYTFNDTSKHLYQQFEPLILKMTSDIPSFRPSTDIILEELFKLLKHHLDEDQNTTKQNMKQFDEYIKVMKEVYQAKSTSEYHAENKNRYYVSMQHLVKNEVNYFKTGQFNPRDKIFNLKHFIPSEALNIKNPQVQFVKMDDLEPRGKFIIKRPQKFIPEIHNKMLSENALKGIVIQKAIKLSDYEKSHQSQSVMLGNNSSGNADMTLQSKSQILQPNGQKSMLESQDQSKSLISNTIKINRNVTNNNAAVNSFKQKFLQNKLLKQKENEEKKQKLLEEQKQNEEKQSLIQNQLNIIESLENTLDQQLQEQQTKMSQENSKKIAYLNEKTQLFSQSKIIKNLMQKEKEYLIRLKSSTPAQVKEVIEGVHQRVDQAQKQADEIQNNFYEIEKKIENDLHKQHIANNVNDEEDKYSIFTNDPFNFDQNTNKKAIFKRNSTLYQVKKEIGQKQQRSSLPNKLDNDMLPQNKDDVIQFLKQGYQDIQQKVANKRSKNKKSLESSKSLQNINLGNQKNSESKIETDSSQKNEVDFPKLKLERNSKSHQQQILGLLQEHFNSLSAEQKSKPLTKKQMLQFLVPQRSKSFIDKKNKKQKDLIRHPTQSQSIQEKKMRKKGGNGRNKILI